VFSAKGGYRSGADYVSGLTPAVYVGAAVVLVGALVALMVPGRSRRRADLGADVLPTSASEYSAGPELLVRPGREVRPDAEPEAVTVADGDVRLIPAPFVGDRRVGATCAKGA
jgi:hypothetical protein